MIILVPIQRLTCSSNHVIGDLQPFACFFPECLGACQDGSSPLTFGSSKAWVNHMDYSHEDPRVRNALRYLLSDTQAIFDEELQHQQHSMQEDGVGETDAELVSDAARRLIPMSECPFCDDFRPPEETTYSFGYAFSSKDLQLHVAAHMEEIALLVLPKLSSGGVTNAENVDGDQLLENDDLGLAISRESTYSKPDGEDLDFQRDDSEAGDGAGGHPVEDICASGTTLDPKDKEDSGMTELHHAVEAGDLDLVEKLVSKGANLSSRDKGGRTALHYASMEESCGSDIMNLLLKTSGKATVNLGDDSGQTALHYAAERGLVHNIGILLDHGADVAITDNYGLSPFLWAVVSGQVFSTDKLLEVAADLHSTRGDGRSALAWVARLLRRWMVGDDVNMVALREAAASGHTDIVQLFLNRGWDPNCRDRDGFSAIHYAAEEGHMEIVRLLLEKGADANAVSPSGTSPLHCAANGGQISIVSLLLVHGADPLMSTCHGWTALHHAAFLGHSHVVQLLLADDRVISSVSQQDNDGWSVLHLAVHSRNQATVDVLIGSPAITELLALVDESGLTAEGWLDLGSTSGWYETTSHLAYIKSLCCEAVTGLRQAVIVGNIPMIKLFIRLGHAINNTHSGRKTALYHAVTRRMLFIMDLLLDGGADPNILPTGRTAWEDFISNDAVLLRLKRAGYQRQDTGPEVERQIRRALRSQGQFSMPNRSVSFTLDEFVSPTSRRPTTHVPDQSSPSVSVSSETSVPDHSTPARQTNNKKRKFDTIRPRARSL